MTKKVLELLALLGIGGAMFFGHSEGQKEIAMEAEREKPVQSSSHVSRSGDGAILIKLDLSQLPILGIQTQTVSLSQGRALVPEAAIVRDGDAHCVFLKTSEASFQKTPVQIEGVTDEGALSVRGLDRGGIVVVRGAQLLLSEELKSQIHIGD